MHYVTVVVALKVIQDSIESIRMELPVWETTGINSREKLNKILILYLFFRISSHFKPFLLYVTSSFYLIRYKRVLFTYSI
jgi:hypothetical protein